MRVGYRLVTLAAAVVVLVGACAKKDEELTTDKAKEVLEASSLFRPQLPAVTLTDAEVQKGLSAGYWTLSAEGEHHRENRQMLLLTPQGRQFFNGQPLMAKPVMTLRQEVSGQLLQVESVQPPDTGGTDRVVTYTYTWKFENQGPEMTEFFKDHPAQEAKKIFRNGDKGWEIPPQ